MFSTKFKGLWAQFILRYPGHPAQDPFWALFSSLAVFFGS